MSRKGKGSDQRERGADEENGGKPHRPRRGRAQGGPDLSRDVLAGGEAVFETEPAATDAELEPGAHRHG